MPLAYTRETKFCEKALGMMVQAHVTQIFNVYLGCYVKPAEIYDACYEALYLDKPPLDEDSGGNAAPSRTRTAQSDSRADAAVPGVNQQRQGSTSSRTPTTYSGSMTQTVSEGARRRVPGSNNNTLPHLKYPPLETVWATSRGTCEVALLRRMRERRVPSDVSNTWTISAETKTPMNH